MAVVLDSSQVSSHDLVRPREVALPRHHHSITNGSSIAETKTAEGDLEEVINPLNNGGNSHRSRSPTQERPDPARSESFRLGRRLSYMTYSLQRQGFVDKRNMWIKNSYRPALQQPLFGSWFAHNIWNINYFELAWWLVMEAIIVATSPAGSGVALSVLISLLLIPKNSLFTYLVGVAYERAVKIHIWFGLFLIVPMIIHGLSQNLGSEWDNQRILGTAGLGLYVAIAAFAHPIIRRKQWEFFKYLHIILVVLFLVAIIVHAGQTIGIIIVGLILYAADMAITIQRACTPAKLVHMGSVAGSDVMALTIKMHSAHRFQAGQYAFINIPKLGWLEWHPFSMCGFPGQDTVVFYIKPLGSWTQKALKALEEDDRVRIDGPYGLPSIPYQTYRTLILVAGGIGVTPLMSILRDALQAVRAGEQYHDVREINFNWTCRTPADFLLFQDTISEIRALDGNPDTLAFKINLFCSKEASGGELGIAYNKARLDPKQLIESYAQPVDKAGCCERMSKGTEQVAVMVCGPAGLSTDLALLCSKHSNRNVAFHFHTETFAL